MTISKVRKTKRTIIKPNQPMKLLMTKCSEPEFEVEEIKGSAFVRGAVYAIKDKKTQKIVSKVAIDDIKRKIGGKLVEAVDLSDEELVGYVQYEGKRCGEDVDFNYLRDKDKKLKRVSYAHKCALYHYFANKTGRFVVGFEPSKVKPFRPEKQRELEKEWVVAALC